MKHGILMMAHNNVEVVRTCLAMLDDPRFTVYLMVDRKTPVEPEAFIPELRHMGCVVLERMPINWAAWSAMAAELSMIEVAVRDGNDYLHFLQGADLPLKSPEAIDRFFTKWNGRNFIQLQPERYELARYKLLVCHYFLDHPAYRTSRLRKGLRYGLAALQKAMRSDCRSALRVRWAAKTADGSSTGPAGRATLPIPSPWWTGNSWLPQSCGRM